MSVVVLSVDVVCFLLFKSLIQERAYIVHWEKELLTKYESKLLSAATAAWAGKGFVKTADDAKTVADAIPACRNRLRRENWTDDDKVSP